MTKTALTGVALAAGAAAAREGRRLRRLGDVPIESIESSAEPLPATPPEAASAQRRLAALQWAVPALTGTLPVLGAVEGEQQRPSAASGLARAALPGA